MARNQVQFQKGLSEARFAEIYGTEEQCHAALVKWRWPNGFECPECNGEDHCVVTRGARRLFQCNACRRQTSVKAGTIFASSKLPLRIFSLRSTWSRNQRSAFPVSNSVNTSASPHKSPHLDQFEIA